MPSPSHTKGILKACCDLHQFIHTFTYVLFCRRSACICTAALAIVEGLGSRCRSRKMPLVCIGEYQIA